MNPADPITRINAALEGRYRIESELGEGGMATVYLADDLKHDRKVALKVLKPELAAVLGAERFLAEIKTTANLTHPHILPLHDSGEAAGFLYYVMPYIDGVTLRDRLEREKQLPVDEAVGIAVDVAEALHSAHEKGVIHRDVKPANILLSEGRPLVADFGIALAVTQAGEGRLTETGLSMGTPFYMSPEQATADREPTAASDVYSLGCVLYEMLVGDPPHAASTVQAVLTKILTEEARAPISARSSIPPNVDADIRMALEKLPADRFQSAAGLAMALTDPQFMVANEQHVTATPRAARTRSLGSLAGWATAVVLAVGLGSVLLKGEGGPTGVGTMQVTLDPGVDQLYELARIWISRDGGTFAITRREGEGSPLYVRGPNEPDFRPLQGTEGARWASFSPGGDWIAYQDHSASGIMAGFESGRLMKVPVSGGRPIPVQTDVEAQEVHWGNDETIVFSSDAGVHRVPSSGGVPERLMGNVLAPHILPDGSGVLSSTFGRAAPSIRFHDIEEDSTWVIIEDGTLPRYLESGHVLFSHPSGGLYVIPFDIETGQTTGERTPIMDGVKPLFYDVSENGTLVYRPGSGTGNVNPNVVDGAIPPTRLVRIDDDGAVDTLRLSPRPIEGTRISPDGGRLIYTDGTLPESPQLYLYDFELGGPTQLTFEGRSVAPVWSADGERVAFASDRDEASNEDLYIQPIDGTGPAVLRLDLTRRQRPSDWTEDGLLIFDDNRDIQYVEAVGDAGHKVFSNSEWAQQRAVVSPDGRRVAYQSNELGEFEVFVRDFPSGQGQRRVSTGGGLWPRWSPAGQTIYYVRRCRSTIDLVCAAEPDTLLAARIQLTPSFLVRSTDVVYTEDVIGGFDVHPDGTHLVVEVAERQPTPQEGTVNLVLNWFEEVQRRLGNE